MGTNKIKVLASTAKYGRLNSSEKPDCDKNKEAEPQSTIIEDLAELLLIRRFTIRFLGGGPDLKSKAFLEGRPFCAVCDTDISIKTKTNGFNGYESPLNLFVFH